MKISKIKLNKDNPRFIRDEKFEKLKKSIKAFPEMMKLRPIIINKDNVILGGNMRFKAIQELGYKEISQEWIYRAKDLNEAQEREFIIKDNVSFGSHDWEVLANQWDNEDLEEWGVDIPEPPQEVFHDEDGIEENLTFKIQVSFDSIDEQLKAKEILEEKGYKVNLM